jgi:hypothetical protein
VNKREKALGIGLVVVLVGWILWSTVDGFLFGRIRTQSARVDELEKSVAIKTAQRDRAMLAEHQTGMWQALSLPPDPRDAQRLYQEWITDIVTVLGFEAPKVTPGQRLPYRGVYTTVAVEIEGDATYETIVRFLYHMQRTSLMHRIAKVELDGNGTSPAVPLHVKITAEGFSFAKAAPRSRLLATTRLAAPLEREGKVVRVEGTEGFSSKPGFEVRLGGEFARVTAIDGDEWTLERGLHRTRTASYPEGHEVEMVLVATAWRERSLDDFEEFLGNNPFALPRRYEPTVSRLVGQTLYRGDAVNTKIAASGYDPARGEPRFELLAGGEVGMAVDAATGALTWTPAEDLDFGTYSARVRVTFPGFETPIERAADFVLRDRNAPPALAAIDDITVTQGEFVSFTAAATDPEGDAVTYQLSGAPAEASIDPGTGEFLWPVGPEFSPGTHEFEVVAEDASKLEGRRKVSVTVRENAARFTILVGTVARDGEREAWLFDQTTKTRTTLHEGTREMIGGIDSFVLVIGQNFVLFQQDDTTYRLDLGRALSEMQEQVAAPAS